MDLFLDAEWFIGGDVFLIGWARDNKTFGQLYDESLTEEAFHSLLEATDGRIYFYGPDIGIIEKYFNIDIRSNYECVNLLKVFKDKMPGMSNYKLATIEKHYGLKRNRNEYKTNIFSIFQDWRRPQVKSLVLQYNMEDVLNLVKLKHIIFWQFDVEENYLVQVRLAGSLQVIRDHVYLLPCDVYRGVNTGKYAAHHGKAEEQPNITSQMVIGAKFFNDKVSLYRMIVLMHDVVKEIQFDYITSVNGRDSKFNLARALATGIALRMKIKYQELLSDHNSKCSNAVSGKRILIIDDVIYKGRTMATAIDACSQQNPASIYFLAFGKSQRFAF
ncbi:MAG: hypothetical protein EKK37_17300 [Sphingobacteriales bacterium]|nr:MAG: hypothetical protein EKK37_17300 [Sphingobacteriales bacterium]